MQTRPINLQSFGWIMAVMAAFAVCATPASAALTNRYVIKDNGGAAVPYDTPANAAASIQTAINYANAGETVLVYAATYDTGGTVISSLTNRVYINKAITVRSIDNDPTNTIIKGAWDPLTTNGPAAVRCVSMVAGSALVGFTLTNGATANSGTVQATGGGVCAPYSTINTVVSNCIIVRNAAYGSSDGCGGGGAANGSLFNCLIKDNVCHNRPGGGAGGCWNMVLSNCTIVGNSSPEVGGVDSGTLFNCMVSNNWAWGGSALAGGVRCRAVGGVKNEMYGCVVSSNSSAYTGGGVYLNTTNSMATNCDIVGNSAYQYGGGRLIQNRTTRTTADGNSGGGGIYVNWESPGYGSVQMVANCTIISNTTAIWNSQGSGVRLGDSIMCNCLITKNSGAYESSAVYVGSAVENCTIVDNVTDHAAVAFGDTYGYRVRNSIIYNNGSDPAKQWISRNANAILQSSCASHTNSNPEGGVEINLSGNTTNNPSFANFSARNYRLAARSPCINTGTNQAWMTGAVDLDGRPRIRYGKVDMGAYEVIYRGTIYGFR